MLFINKIPLKRFLLFIILATGTYNLSANSTHRFATYNIRYGVKEDTGDKAWENRKSYVMQIIRDYDFDIAGLQEVTGNTTYPQLQDMQAELTEYNFIPYERSGTGDYSYNVVIYKKDRYECLDHGCFWVSPTPTTASIGWDGEIMRTVIWSKMKESATGKIFYFCATHTDGPKNQVGRKGAKVITDRLKKIVGDHPMMFVGDLNHRRTDGWTTYRGFAANFYDTYYLAETTSVPIPNTTITAQNWYPADNINISGSEFDYIYCNNIEVSHRYIINENYGRSVNPSDHFPVLAICRLLEQNSPKSIYVDQSAGTSGDGTLANPYKTIDEALIVVKIRDTIKVAAGIYMPELNQENPRASCYTPQTSIVMIGGYNSSFSEITGKTVITGDVNNDDAEGNYSDNLYQLISIPQYYNLTLKNFTLEHACAEGLLTGAALYTEGFELELDSVEFRNNYAATGGGALYASCEYVTINNCIFEGNRTTGNGGGAHITALSDFTLYNSYFKSNEAAGGSGISISQCENSFIQNNIFEGNLSEKYGTLYFMSNSNVISHNLLNNSFANNHLNVASGLPAIVQTYGGAAIYAKMASTDMHFNMAHTTIVGNTSVYTGSNTSIFNSSACNIFGGTVILMNNIIADNYGTNGNGDLYVDENTVINKDAYNLFTSTDNVNIELNSTDIAANTYSRGINALTQTLNGKVEENKFSAVLKVNEGYTPTVNVVSPYFDNNAINILTTNLRLIESSFQADMDGDGKISGYLTHDQRTKSRKISSCIGAAEYFEGEISSVKNPEQNGLTIYRLANSVYELQEIAQKSDVRIYDTMGNCVQTIQDDSSSVILNFCNMPQGIYFIYVNGAAHKIIK